MRFLVTRPEPDGQRTAEKIRDAGHVADEAPLLQFVAEPPVRFDLTGIAALAFSSRRAVAALRDHQQLPELRHLPVFTVGDATFEACRTAGYLQVFSASGDVSALAQLIVDHRLRPKNGVVLYPAALERAGDLEGLLAAAGVGCRTCVVYKMVEAQTLPEPVVQALQRGAYDGLLIYSRRTAETFLRLLRMKAPDHKFTGLQVFAISRQAAEPLSNYMSVNVAERPCENALLDLALGEY